MRERNQIEGDMVESEQSAGSGDGPAEKTLETVMSEHESALLRYASRLLNNAEAAQDVVQDAFIRLHRNWTVVAGDGRLSSWLYRTTHNAAVDYIRRESRLRRLHDEQAAEVPDTEPATQSMTLEENERKSLALQHLAKLDPAEKQVLILRLQEGLSYKDISHITGRTEGNVGCLLHHATKNLARSLKKAGVIA